MVVNMPLVRMYGYLILNGRKTIDEVPKNYKEAVEEYVKEQQV